MSVKVIRHIHLPEFCSRNFFDICDGVADANNSPSTRSHRLLGTDHMRSVQRLRRKSKQQLPELQELWNLFAADTAGEESGMRNVIFLLIYQNPVEFNIYENLEGTPVELVKHA